MNPVTATLSSDEAFTIYRDVRDRVRGMLAEWQSRDDSASAYWSEEIEGFDYLLDATPAIVHKLREHCYHLTGIRSYEYRRHHSHAAPRFAAKLARLRALDAKGLFVPEAEVLGGFGHMIDGARVNLDTLKFYEVLLGMDRAGLLPPKGRADDGRPLVLEIGAGWGGFAYQMKTLFPQVRSVIIDLPSTLLFSAVYLRCAFPGASAAFYNGESAEELAAIARSHDFLFLPHYALDRLAGLPLDLALNMISFQEMTSGQVGDYCRTVQASGCPSFYSLNRDRSTHNKQLSSVSEILASHYDVRRVDPLDVDYTQLAPPKQPSAVQRVLRSLRKKESVSRPWEYRHLAGTRRPA